ncbi:MAG: DNA-binding protein [Ruminococcus sp.]|nr:DNA-binding protein [Ruminococcus sp.]
MSDIEKITSPEQLFGEQRELAETVGLEAYRKLVKNYGGMTLYIPKREIIPKDVRNKEIKKSINGSNYRELARKYELSEMTIRRIIKK